MIVIRKSRVREKRKKKKAKRNTQPHFTDNPQREKIG